MDECTQNLIVHSTRIGHQIEMLVAVKKDRTYSLGCPDNGTVSNRTMDCWLTPTATATQKPIGDHQRHHRHQENHSSFEAAVTTTQHFIFFSH